MGSTPRPEQFPVRSYRRPETAHWDAMVRQGSDCEFLHEYTGDGLCPVIINDVLGGADLVYKGKQCSFHIIGKLGWGSYSTVWLGRDM